MKQVSTGNQSWQFKNYLDSKSFQQFVEDNNVHEVKLTIEGVTDTIQSPPKQMTEAVNNTIKLKSFNVNPNTMFSIKIKALIKLNEWRVKRKLKRPGKDCETFSDAYSGARNGKHDVIFLDPIKETITLHQ